jgi:hypothetical protein
MDPRLEVWFIQEKDPFKQKEAKLSYLINALNKAFFGDKYS